MLDIIDSLMLVFMTILNGSKIIECIELGVWQRKGIRGGKEKEGAGEGKVEGEEETRKNTAGKKIKQQCEKHSSSL